MQKSKIEWTDYSINPVKGKCPMACSYCYARRMYDRFKWNPEIRYVDPGFTIAEIQSIKEPSRIFVGSTMELFGEWISDLWLKDTFQIVRQFPQHTFIFLTKCPQNLRKWSPFPDNCWVGCSATDYKMFAFGMAGLKDVEAKVKFVSIEPMLERLNTPLLDQALQNCGISWVIIGQQTPVKPATMPNIEWVRETVEAADKAGWAVFLKDNLTRVTSGQEWAGKWVEHDYQPPGEEIWWHPRQEFPKVQKDGLERLKSNV